MSIKKISDVHIVKLFPNILTISGLCIGVTAVRYSFDMKWEMAVILIIVAAFIDGIDGRVANLLQSTGRFGAQLDSTSDMVNFGFVPALVTYMWCLKDTPVKGVGWFVVLFYVTCAAIRLARFNANMGEEKDENQSGTFSGVPVPAAALLLMLPMIFTLDLAPSYQPNYLFMSCYTIALGLLMVSTIPTLSLKKTSIKRNKIPYIMLCVGILITGLINRPWIILPIILILYLLSLPTFATLRLRKK